MPQVGRSGGLVCIWDPLSFQEKQVISNRNFISITGTWNDIVGDIFFVNVYAQ